MKDGAKQRIQAAASEMFYADGLRVGVDAIIAAAGVAKASFYKHFPTKDDLVLDFLVRRDAVWREWLTTTVEALAPGKAGRPLAVFDALEQRFRRQDFRGCAFINSMVEVADPAHPAHQAAARHKHAVISYLTGLLDAAGYTDPSLAFTFMLLMDGATVTAVREGTSDSAAAAKRTAEMLLRSAPRTPNQEMP